MDNKLYIKKFIRDDGQTLAFDGNEIYLDEDNTLLVRPDPNTTAINYTEADGGEMIHQQNVTYEQTVNGLIIPRITDYWNLTGQLSFFFRINHTYKIVYVKKDGSMFMTSGAWISAGLQIIPVPDEEYSRWNITFTIGDMAWTEYSEDSQGKEIYSNNVSVPLLSINPGGEVWEASETQTLSGEGTSFTINGTVSGATISDLGLKGNTYQQTYSGKNKINGSYSEISQTVRCTAEASGNGFTITSTESSGATYVTVPIPNSTSLLGETVTVSYVATGDAIKARFYYLNSSNNATSSIGSTETVTLPNSLGNNAGIGVVFYTSNNSSATYTNIQLEIGSTATQYEQYVGGTPSPNPDCPQNVQTVTGEQTITVSDGESQSQSYTVDLGSIELCKIGDYQDYIYKGADGWYVHKDIGKINVASTGISAFNTHNGTHITVNYSDASVERLSTAAVTNVSDRFVGSTTTQVWSGSVINGVAQPTNGNYLQFSLPISVATTQAEVRTYFDNHPTIVYYTLATPTDTKITDASLISDLEALVGASAYSWQTNYSVSSSNLESILALELTQTSGGGEVWDNVGSVWQEGTGGLKIINTNTTQIIYPVWEVNGPCVNPSLQNDTTDSLAEFDGTIAQGQTLTVNFAEGTAYIGTARVNKYLTGSVSLAPGDNTIGFNSEGGNTEECTISWNNIIN